MRGWAACRRTRSRELTAWSDDRSPTGPRHGRTPMAVCKTGAEHLRSLQDGRKVFIDGKSVADVTTHDAFRNSVASAASLYDFQAAPENIEFMTFACDGANRRANRSWQMPRSYAETVERRKALIAWAELSYGFMGRSPDHLASALVGQRMGLDVFEQLQPGAGQGVRGLFRLRHPQRPVPDLRDHQSAGRPLQGLGRAGRRTWWRAWWTRIPAASPFAAPRCWVPARSWPTRCWSPICSR